MFCGKNSELYQSEILKQILKQIYFFYLEKITEIILNEWFWLWILYNLQLCRTEYTTMLQWQSIFLTKGWESE